MDRQASLSRVLLAAGNALPMLSDWNGATMGSDFGACHSSERRWKHGLPLARIDCLGLPYDGSQLSMVFLLPAADQLDNVRSGLSHAWLEQAMAGASAANQVQITLPKFRFTWGTQSLKQPLMALGIKDAFVYPTADFSGIEPKRELYIGDVYHKAFVGLDEHGTEAAAATAVVLRAGAAPTQPAVFAANRPFFFLIRDSSGTILFLGLVGDPSAS
jgi:serpin B